jgi:hypothetical protein
MPWKNMRIKGWSPGSFGSIFYAISAEKFGHKMLKSAKWFVEETSQTSSANFCPEVGEWFRLNGDD